jgi:hypothetical protein
MDVKAEDADDTGAPHDGKSQNIDFGFLPKSLISQCQVLIESFHELHGYPRSSQHIMESRARPLYRGAIAVPAALAESLDHPKRQEVERGIR